MEKIKTNELVKIINKFRKQNKEKIECKHKTLLERIRKEKSMLLILGKLEESDFECSTYFDSINKEQPCFNLKKEEVEHIISNESEYVRNKVYEYLAGDKEINNNMENEKIISLLQEIYIKTLEIENYIKSEKNINFKEFRKNIL